ncbi:unnamed protein product, partial [Staurois parvus]
TQKTCIQQLILSAFQTQSGKSHLYAFEIFFLTLPVPNALQSLFFIMKSACKAFSRYSAGQNTVHRMFLPSLSHIVMNNSHLRPSHPWKQKIC